MKKSKKLLSSLLSLIMIFGSVFVTSAAGNTVEKKVSLFDLSELSVGEAAELPDGIEWWSGRNTYTGTREVVEVNGKKALKQNFNAAVGSWNTGNLVETNAGKTALKLSIPKVYAPYIKAINLDVTNNTESSIKYEFGILNGTMYSKKAKTNDDFSGVNISYTADLTKLYKSNDWWWVDHYGINYKLEDGTEKVLYWTTEDIATATEVFLILSTPKSGCDGTEGLNLIINDISLTLSGDEDAINEAVASVAEAWKTVFDFEEYEAGISKPGGINTSGTAKVVEDRAYAISGTKTLEFVNTATATYDDKDIWIPLNSYVKKATGVSFWIYNKGKQETFKMYLYDGNNKVSQNVFTVPSGSYIKLSFDFADMREIKGDDYNTWENNVKKSLTAEEIASLKNIILKPLKNNTEAHPGFYIDDVKYEKNTKAYSQTVPFDNVTFGDGTNAEVSDGKIVFTPTETSVTAFAKITVPEKFFAGASAVTFNFTNTMSEGFSIGALVTGTNDDGKSGFYWKWGDNKDAMYLSAGADNSSSGLYFDGSNKKIFESNDGWWIDNWCGWDNNPPSGSEKMTFTTLDLRIFNFNGTEGTVILNSITVTYEGNSVKQASNIENGSVSFERSTVFAGDKAGFTVIPANGYTLKDGSVKLIYSNGTEIALDKRDGFRKTNMGYYYTFDMPEADVTVSAEFIPTETMTVTAAANESDKSLKFDLSVALENTNTTLIAGIEREIISVGALVTTDDLLTLYYPDSSFESLTRELAASNNYIANAIDDINIGANGTGLIYDRAKEFIRFNVILNNLSAESRKANFYVRGYIEYKNDNGDKEIAYIDTETYCYNTLVYGEFYDTVSLTKGISYAGAFEKAGIANISKTDKVFDKATFEDIAVQGFDHVRIPVDFSANTDDTTTDYKFVSGALETLDIVVKNAMQAGLTVVLDFHQECKLNDDTLYTNPTAVSPKYIKIWEQLAEHYKDYPKALVFEVINEPAVDDTTFTNGTLMNLQEQVLEISKRANASRNIIVTVRNANSSYQLTDLSDKLKTDKNVIVSAHCYDPMYFTHQGAEWLDYPKGVNFTETIADDIKAAINNCAAFEKATGRTVILGEFGVYLNGASMDDATQYIKTVTDYCAEKGIDWCYWEYNAGFGAYNESAKIWKPDILTALGLQ